MKTFGEALINRREIMRAISDIYMEERRSEDSCVSMIFIENEEFVFSKLAKIIENNIVDIENILLKIDNFSYFIDINTFRIHLSSGYHSVAQYFFNDRSQNEHLCAFNIVEESLFFKFQMLEIALKKENDQIYFNSIYTQIKEREYFKNIADNINSNENFYNYFHVDLVESNEIKISELKDLQKSIKNFLESYIKNNKNLCLEYLKYSEFIFELMEASQIITENRNYIRDILNNNYIIKLKKEDFEVLEIQYDLSKETINKIYFVIDKIQKKLQKINIIQ